MKLHKRVINVVSATILSMSSVFILAPTVHAAGNTCLWNGSVDGSFSNASNWTNCGAVAPNATDSLEFPATANTYALTNDLTAGTVFDSITFNGALTTPTCAASSYTISGNSFSISGSFIFDHTGACAISNGYEVFISAPYVNGAGAHYVDGSTSSIFSWLTFSGGITGATSLITRSANLDVANVNSGVSLGVQDGGILLHRVADCSSATIASNVQAGGDNNTILVWDGSGACDAFTLSSFTLSSNASVSAGYEKTATITTWTNPSGGYTLTVPDGSTSKIIVGGQTLEGAYIETTVSTDNSVVPYTTFGKEKITVTETGKTGAFNVAKYGYLMGNGGTVGTLSVAAGGFLAPGNSPGCLNSGNLTLAGTYEVEIQGATACTGYDQTNVTGTVNVTGGTLNASTTGFVPTAGQTYTIINNDGSDAVTGTFAGLAEGAQVVNAGVTYTISYAGGDGNDVVLTVVSVDASAIPGAPNTGFMLLSSNPLVSLLGGLIAAAGLGLLARRKFEK